MSALLVRGALDGTHGWDHFFRKDLSSLIPNLRALVERPADVLAYQEVRIGPCHRYVSSTIIGILVGAGLTGALAMFARDLELGDWTLIRNCSVFLLLTLPPICIWLCLHLTRGGEVILTRTTAELRYGRRRVVCPWPVFCAPGEPAALSYDRLAIPISAAAPQIVCFVGDVLVGCGYEVESPQFRLRRSDSPRVTGIADNLEAVLGDYYAGRLDEIACLLLIVGRELGRPGAKSGS
jgi:hypothetical protein